MNPLTPEFSCCQGCKQVLRKNVLVHNCKWEREHGENSFLPKQQRVAEPILFARLLFNQLLLANTKRGLRRNGCLLGGGRCRGGVVTLGQRLGVDDNADDTTDAP